MIKQIKFYTVTLLAISGFAQAATVTVPPPSDNHKVVIAIEELGNRMEGLAKAGIKSVNMLAYQLDKSFTTSMQLNANQEEIQGRLRKETLLAADRAVKLNLAPFASATLTYTDKNQPEVKMVNTETNLRQNYIKQLTNLEASDSIYSLVQGIEVSSYWTKKNLGKPSRNDDAFNFSALVEPEVYSPEQVKNSENFIGYATKQYQSYADGINLSQLRSALAQYQKNGTQVLSQQIDQFRKDAAYQKYQLTVRSLTANKSVATDIFATLAAERKPILTTQADAQLDTISRAIGVEPQVISLKNEAGENVTMFRYASPMQIAKFRANNRLNNPSWYQEVASDSAENLQRKSVILLAEISSQLYQNHLDNEKMMGSLAMMNLQLNDLSSTTLPLQVKDVNDAISAFAASANASHAPTPLTPSTP